VIEHHVRAFQEMLVSELGSEGEDVADLNDLRLADAQLN
jgi:hypothetical protein